MPVWVFRSPKDIRAYFDKVVSIVPPDLKFVVEDITDGDPRKVGVAWCAPQPSIHSLREGKESFCVPSPGRYSFSSSATPRGS